MVTLLSARIMSSMRCNIAGVAISTSRPTRCWLVEIAMSALPRTYAPNYGLLDVTGNAHCTQQHFFADILCCHIFCPQKPHNATLFYCGTRIQGHRHLAPSLLSCAHRSLRIAIKLDSAAI
jgi:hypothetical protein